MKNKTILLIAGAAALPFIIEALFILVAEPFYSQMPEWGI
jgi:hypothetical protein